MVAYLLIVFITGMLNFDEIPRRLYEDNSPSLMNYNCHENKNSIISVFSTTVGTVLLTVS